MDVTPDGRVDNVQILSAKPANMFEREVKMRCADGVMSRVSQAVDCAGNILFKINGTTEIQ